MCNHTKFGEIALEFHLRMPKRVYLLSPIQRGPSATYPAPIMSICEIKTRIGVRMRKPLNNFRISAQRFYRSQNQLKWVLSRGICDRGTAQTAQYRAVRIISRTSRHPNNVPFVGEFWWESSDARFGCYKRRKKNKFRRLLPSTFRWVMTQE